MVFLLKEVNINQLKEILICKLSLKKIADLPPIIENTEDSVLYVEDETGIRIESVNRRSWSPVGQSPIVESNNTHAGFNIIGATEISKNYNTLINIYPAKHSITSIEMLEFLKQLLEQNKGKKIFLIWDNYNIHKAKNIEEFAQLHNEELFLINLPPYSPMLNPQENVWKWLKDTCFQCKARESIDKFKEFIEKLFLHCNSDKMHSIIKPLVNAKSYYK
ncbi:IS630 family transposase [Clostridium pasteurianum]|uniref:IS630 family transposase n=1 Tax=Clostridium pasteurianum TaxID=1501 RepID=UPI0006872992|nr:IS630 family transposase [Clostridium pasteurianum]